MISPKTLESIQNHLMRNNPVELPRAEELNDNTEINGETADSGEVVDLDCEVEILSTDNEGM